MRTANCATTLLLTALLSLASAPTEGEPTRMTPDPSLAARAVAPKPTAAQSCGPSARVEGSGTGASCTAARNDLSANLLADVQAICGEQGVCTIGRLGITKPCTFDPALGAYVVEGSLGYQCNA